jgi:hypothetical protein
MTGVRRMSRLLWVSSSASSSRSSATAPGTLSRARMWNMGAPVQGAGVVSVSRSRMFTRCLRSSEVTACTMPGVSSEVVARR